MLTEAPTSLGVPRTRGRTAFERNMLPRFAPWFVREVDRRRPDLLIPTETKGARLLEIVVAYARDQLGTPIGVPVISRMALPYLSPDFLSGCVALVLEDALCTGATLRRHKGLIQQRGVREVSAVACVAHAGEQGRRLADSFRLADAAHYREYVWMLTELVVARGLPPEIDHLLFRLKLPERLPIAWERLAEDLGRYGALTLDGPEVGDQPTGMTLHFPRLPGTHAHGCGRWSRREGVHKLRLYPDPAGDGAYAAPISFPVLTLQKSSLSADEARRLMSCWTGREHSIGELLVEQAHVYEAETVFRMLSTCAEIDLICGLARALRRAFPDEPIGLTVDRSSLLCLYGPHAAPHVAEHVDAQLRAALAEPVPERRPATPAPAPLPLDDAVVETTEHVAKQLKNIHMHATVGQERSPGERIGLSFTDVVDQVPRRDRLLASRCLGYGLARTTLVPYVEVEVRGETFVVTRKYRVSEINRNPDEFKSRGDVDREIAEATIAFVVNHLRRWSQRYEGRPVPASILACLMAIVGERVFVHDDIVLQLRPGEEEPELVLRNEPRPAPLLVGSTRMFTATVDGVAETATFRRTLKQDARVEVVLAETFMTIEGWLRDLVPVLDDAPDEASLRAMLTAWAMCTDGRLGLTHVQHDLERALDRLRAPLEAMQAGQPHDPLGADAYEEVHGLVDAAVRKLEALSHDWSGHARAQLTGPLMRQRALLGTLGAPAAGASAIYDVARALAHAVKAVARMVERLDKGSAAAWRTRPTTAHEELARTALADADALKRTLTSLREPSVQPRPTSGGHELLAEAAKTLGWTVRMLRRGAAAIAGTFPDRRRQSAPAPAVRSKSVLMLDLSGSTAHGQANGLASTNEWRNGALNLASQWAQTLGGWEPQQRAGDDVWLAFAGDGDRAVVCAALVQEHVRALRSIGARSPGWVFHAAIDDGETVDGDAGNVAGLGLDNAAKLAKHRSTAGQPDPQRVLITDGAARHCSPALQPPETRLLSPCTEDVDVGGRPIRPLRLDTAAIVARVCERLLATAQQIERRPAVPARGREDVLRLEGGAQRETRRRRRRA